MKSYGIIFCLFFLLGQCLFLSAQTDTTSGKYKRYYDKHNRFSFLMPIEWDVVIDKDGELPDMAFLVKKDTSQESQQDIFTISTYDYGIKQGVCDSAFMRNHGFRIFFDTPDYPDFLKISKNSNGDRYWASFEYKKITHEEDMFWIKENDSIDTRIPLHTDTLYFIQGENWKGYRHKSDCNTFQDRGSIIGIHGDYCETLFFYDGKHPIIELSTNGNSLEEKVREKILDSFRYD